MDGEAALLVDHRVARIRAAVPADDEVRITREQIDNFALAFVAPMAPDDSSYRHATYFTSLAFARIPGLGGALRAPLGPVVASLVPRCALLPAPTPRMRTRCARGGGLASGPTAAWCYILLDGRLTDDPMCETHDRRCANVGSCASAKPVG